ncbi:uncharacterized protein LOC117337019 [Pecten maximus]|uniref:uncharacterized protein LOC117337019 n=1 Tax=Pecten maximus TaxID=6579 RepID=UPI00145837C6|nr:uncharacterized protein LOC117337019 [Pecten maximus]
MVQICNYSSLIFAGNVTVLLIVSMTTDYWEYRGFNSTRLNMSLFGANNTELMRPADTNSYMELWYKRKYVYNTMAHYHNETLYEPPIFARNFFHKHPQDRTNISGPRAVQHGPRRSGNIHEHMKAGVVILFQQYGNLFRDCDALEEGVRLRLNLMQERKTKCEYLSGRDGLTALDTTHLYAVPHLERAASAFALLCMLSMVTGLVTGGYGLLGRQTRVLVLASCCSLVAGLLLTLAIALFHGKCHILRRTEILAGYLIPHKKVINESRTYSFGWSFGLAWICVFLCFTSSFVWLYKAQDPRHSRSPGSNYVRHRTYTSPDYVTYMDENDIFE